MKSEAKFRESGAIGLSWENRREYSLGSARVADALRVFKGEYPYIEKGMHCNLRFEWTNALKNDLCCAVFGVN